MITSIVMFVFGYLAHKYKDTLIVKMKETTAKIQAFLNSQR